MKKSSKNNPLLCSVIIRGLYILDGIKNYTLIVLNIPYPFYVCSSFIINSFYILKNILIGYQLQEISDLVTKKKSWNNIDLAEKIFFGVVLGLVVFSTVASTFFTMWAKRKMKSKILFILN